MPIARMGFVIHRGRFAALSGDRVWFAPHIEVLEPDHPERRFVSALCLYRHAVDTGQAGRPYDQRDAERFARELLMPPEAFDPVVRWSDAELAELFNAPLDQVRVRRRERAAASL